MYMEFGKQHYRKVDHLQTEVSPIVTPTMSTAYVQDRSFVPPLAVLHSRWRRA